MAQNRFSFKCACGQVHEGAPNYGFTAPDSFMAQPEKVRAAAVHRRDLCAYETTSGERLYFARALLALPIQGRDDPFMWGIWVQLGFEDYQKYLDAYERADAQFRFEVRIANTLPFYPETAGLPALLVPRSGRQLATVQLAPGTHRLSLDFNEGLDLLVAAKIAASICLAARSRSPDGNQVVGLSPV